MIPKSRFGNRPSSTQSRPSTAQSRPSTAQSRVTLNRLTDIKKEGVNIFLELNKLNDIDGLDENGYSVLFYASIAGDLNLVKYICEERKAKIDTNIFVATCYNGHVDVIQYFLSKNKKLINKLTKKGKCGLSMAVRGGHVEMVKLLALTPDADLALKDSDGKYPLEYFNVEQTSNDYRTILAKAILQKIPLMKDENARTRYIDSLHQYIIAVGNNKYDKIIQDIIEELKSIQTE